VTIRHRNAENDVRSEYDSRFNLECAKYKYKRFIEENTIHSAQISTKNCDGSHIECSVATKNEAKNAFITHTTIVTNPSKSIHEANICPSQQKKHPY
jgi:hypothetical protein